VSPPISREAGKRRPRLLSTDPDMIHSWRNTGGDNEEYRGEKKA